MNRILVVAATDGELAGLDAAPGVEPLACGVGPVEAAASVAVRLAVAPAVDVVLHVGIAGARRASGIDLRAVVIGTEAIYCDTRSHLVPRTARADDRLLAQLAGALPDARQATIGTAADVGGTTECDVEAMEGFAVLRAAHRAGVPAIELRVVSNHVEEDDRAKWDFAGALAVLADVTRTSVDALRGSDA